MTRMERAAGRRVGDVPCRLASVVLTCGVASLLLASHAAASVIFENEFLSSSTGTSSVRVGDTIAFETFVTLEGGIRVAGVYTAFTGDIDGSLSLLPGVPCPHGPHPCFRNTEHIVTDWRYGGRRISDLSSVGITRVSGTPQEIWISQLGPGNPELELGNPVFLGIGVSFATRGGTRYEGTGVKSLMGTVTIRAGAAGTFNAGTLIYPGVTGAHDIVTDSETGLPKVIDFETSVIPAVFTVANPEPGTATLLATGLVAMAVRRRRQRARRSAPNVTRYG